MNHCKIELELIEYDPENRVFHEYGHCTECGEDFTKEELEERLFTDKRETTFRSIPKSVNAGGSPSESQNTGSRQNFEMVRDKSYELI